MWINAIFPENQTFKIQISLTPWLVNESAVFLTYFEKYSTSPLILTMDFEQSYQGSIRGFLKNIEYCLGTTSDPSGPPEEATVGEKSLLFSKNPVEILARLGIFGSHYIEECLPVARLLDLRMFLNLLESAKFR